MTTPEPEIAKPETVEPEIVQLEPAPVQWHYDIKLNIIFLAVACGVLLMSVLMRSEGESQVFLPGTQTPMPSTCSTKVMLGIDCPGCGLTRAFIAISHGRFLDAWSFNRASFFVYAFVAAQLPWHLIQIWRRFNNRPLLDTDLVYFVPIGLAIVLFGNWLLRLPAMLAAF